MYLKTQIENLLRLAKEQESYEPYYEVLQYIETDGTQYYKTGEILSSTSKVECRASVLGAATSSGSAYIFGAYGANKNFGINRASSTGSFCVWGSNSTAFTPTLSLDIFYDISLSSDGLYVDGSKVTTPSGTFAGANEAYISWANGTSQPVAKIKLACLKIYQSGVLTKDYIPVLDSKMRPCLYDKVSKTFLYAKKISDNTTAYDLGFKRWNKFDVDYIASDGNQYINTGFKFTNTSAFEITCAEVGDFESSTVLCGARNNTDTTSNARIVDYSYSAPSVLRGEYLLLQRGGYDVNENVIYIPYDTEFHTYYQSPTRMSIDDTDRPTVPSLTSPNMDFYIFWQNVGTATAPAKAKIKVKRQKLWDNGTLVRDYKPSVRTYNDGTSVVTKAFLYDEVYNKAYDNAGTGSFKAYIIGYGNVFTRTGETTGKFIDANGTIQTNTNSAYSDLLPIKGGETVTCKSGTASGNNYRYHVYDSSGTWIEQGLVLNPSTTTAVTGSFVAPSNASYVRVSYANATTSDVIQVNSSLATYEVGSSIQNTETAYIATGVHPTENTGVRTVYNYIENSSNSAGVVGTYNSSTETTLYVSTYSGTTATSTTIGLYHRAGSLDTVTIMPKPLIGVKHIASINYMNDGQFNFDDDETLNKNVGTGTVINQEIRLFGRYRGGSYSNTKCAIGYTEFTEDKDFLAKLVPVKNATVATDVGYFDKVSKDFITTPTSTLTWNALD